jgi:ABC-type nitrate/sulfonate/bicarbonate transport system permease component
MIAAVRVAESDKVFAGIVCAAVIGSALIHGFALLRRRLLVWHAETSSMVP